MKLPELRRTAACLATALFIGGAWFFHVSTAAHNAADNDCQVCASVCSPELNSDCGTELLAKPANFSFVEPSSSREPVRIVHISAFSGRAPPLA